MQEQQVRAEPRIRWQLKMAVVAGMIALPMAAMAQQAVTRAGISLMAGPGNNYPVVAMLGEGQPVDVMGCTQGYGWCDVMMPDGLRGWIYARGLAFPYQGGPVPLPSYAPVIGVPIISFSIGSYWGSYYRDRSWYGEPRWWGGRPPPPPMAGWRPPPPVHPGWQPRPPPPNWRPPPPPNYGPGPRPPGPPSHGGPPPRPYPVEGRPPPGRGPGPGGPGAGGPPPGHGGGGGGHAGGRPPQGGQHGGPPDGGGRQHGGGGGHGGGGHGGGGGGGRPPGGGGPPDRP